MTNILKKKLLHSSTNWTLQIVRILPNGYSSRQLHPRLKRDLSCQPFFYIRKQVVLERVVWMSNKTKPQLHLFRDYNCKGMIEEDCFDQSNNDS